MRQTQFVLLQDVSSDLKDAIKTSGSIKCLTTPPIYLTLAPVFDEHKTQGILSPRNLIWIKRWFQYALSCTYENIENQDMESKVGYYLQVVATAFQIVKPIRGFLEYRLKSIEDNGLETISSATPALVLPVLSASPYLLYQQHHVITSQDAERAINLLPNLMRVQELGYGSWNHPFSSVHRAAHFFARGYSLQLEETFRQLLWAAGLDSLFASKIKKQLQSSNTISQRMQKLFGKSFNPYQGDTVAVPLNQRRPKLSLDKIGQDIFRLRNDFIHGNSITHEDWLHEQQPELGYAYQLTECTEILLRLSLLKSLEDSSLLDVLINPTELDNYFS